MKPKRKRMSIPATSVATPNRYQQLCMLAQSKFGVIITSKKPLDLEKYPDNELICHAICDFLGSEGNVEACIRKSKLKFTSPKGSISINMQNTDSDSQCYLVWQNAGRSKIKSKYFYLNGVFFEDGCIENEKGQKIETTLRGFGIIEESELGYERYTEILISERAVVRIDESKNMCHSQIRKLTKCVLKHLDDLKTPEGIGKMITDMRKVTTIENLFYVNVADSLRFYFKDGNVIFLEYCENGFRYCVNARGKLVITMSECNHEHKIYGLEIQGNNTALNYETDKEGNFGTLYVKESIDNIMNRFLQAIRKS